jgi:hypothetical protein
MKTSAVMKNEALTPILYEIESRILAHVRTASAEGIALNDSHIRSILNKVRKTSEGKPPKIPNESPRDRLLARLHESLLDARQSFFLEDESGEATILLPTSIWTACIRTIEESIQRHSTGPGSIGYQQFIGSFIGSA